VLDGEEVTMNGVRFAALGSVWRALRAGTRPGTPGIGDRLRALPRLVRLTAIGRYAGTTRVRLLLMAVAAVYVVSPVDLVPELFVPFLGLVDDAFVLAWLAGAVLLETERFLGWERDQQRVVSGEVVR
jgi:uncharacterized membrane protein YkvA (DUF1232 family)